MNFELREQVLFDLYQMKLSKKAVPLRADLRNKDRYAKGAKTATLMEQGTKTKMYSTDV